MTGKTFTCEMCGKVFPLSPEDEEDARTELLATFGDVNTADYAQVCDDCYRAIVG